MKISEAIAKKSAALQSLTADIANSHNLLQEYSEAAAMSPSHYLNLTTSIMAYESDAKYALAAYGDVDLADQDDIDAMAADRASELAAGRNKSLDSDYYTFTEENESARLDNALKFMRAINSVNI
jgi:hypothetical protein